MEYLTTIEMSKEWGLGDRILPPSPAVATMQQT